MHTEYPGEYFGAEEDEGERRREKGEGRIAEKRLDVYTDMRREREKLK
jgi:hypothetical protein